MKNKKQSNTFTTGNTLDLNKTWSINNKNVKYDTQKGYFIVVSSVSK